MDAVGWDLGLIEATLAELYSPLSTDRALDEWEWELYSFSCQTAPAWGTEGEVILPIPAGLLISAASV